MSYFFHLLDCIQSVYIIENRMASICWSHLSCIKVLVIVVQIIYNSREYACVCTGMKI